MSSRVSIPWILLIWLVIGVLVAANKGYADNIDKGADEVATFILAVVLWPIPALDGAVAIRF
jgi:hypothetical protein